MIQQLIGVILIWLSSLFIFLIYLAASEKFLISKQSISYKWIGAILLLLSTLGFGWQSYHTYTQDAANRRLRQVITDTNSRLFNEASGGAAVHDVAYLVDDEKPRIFKLRWVDGLYHYADEIKLKVGGRILTTDDVDDLESAAVLPGERFNNRIYLLTSHSNTKKGNEKPERSKILEVSLDEGNEGTVFRTNGRLRESILNVFKQAGIEPYKNSDGDLEVMQIEGLAIDPNGFAYLGFRAPLDNEKRAIVLRSRLDELFTANPSFTLFRLNLADDGKEYSISSLDYDPQSQKIWIVANSPEKSKTYPPLLWTWDTPGLTGTTAIQSPKKIAPILLSNSGVGRPEVLLFPPALFTDEVFLFLDTDDQGNGGQISIKRSDLKLK